MTLPCALITMHSRPPISILSHPFFQVYYQVASTIAQSNPTSAEPATLGVYIQCNPIICLNCTAVIFFRTMKLYWISLTSAGVLMPSIHNLNMLIATLQGSTQGKLGLLLGYYLFNVFICSQPTLVYSQDLCAVDCLSQTHPY